MVEDMLKEMQQLRDANEQLKKQIADVSTHQVSLNRSDHNRVSSGQRVSSVSSGQSTILKCTFNIEIAVASSVNWCAHTFWKIYHITDATEPR